MRLTLHLARGRGLPGLRAAAAGTRGCATLRARPTRSSTRSADASSPPGSQTPRTNVEIRARMTRTTAPDPYTPILWRPHAACRSSSSRPPATGATRGRDALFVIDPRPLPDPEDAATLVLTRYLDGVRARRRSATSPPGRASPSATSTSTRRDGQLPRRARPRADRPARRPDPRPATRRSRRASSPTGTSRCSPTRTATGSSRPRSSRSSSRSAATRRSPSTAASSPAGRWRTAA